MDKSTVDDIMKALCERHTVVIDASDVVRADLEKSLSALPEGGTWAIANAAKPAVFARSDLFFFTVTLEDAGRVALTSRTLDPDKLAVRLEWGDRVSDETKATKRQTKWTFRDGDSLQTFVGTITTQASGSEECDRDETFARELAQLAGWTLSAEPPRMRVLGG